MGGEESGVETVKHEDVEVPPRNPLAAALVAAQKHAGNVPKASTNSFHRYRYASGEDVIAEARRALSDAGLALAVERYSVDHREPHDYLCAEYVLMHESGDSRQWSSSTPIIPEKGRPADKALAAAKTYDLAYFLRALLLLPRVEEDAPDPDRRDDRSHEPRRKAPAKAQGKPHQGGPVADLRTHVQAVIKAERKRLGDQRANEAAEQIAGAKLTRWPEWTEAQLRAVADQLPHVDEQVGGGA